MNRCPHCNVDLDERGPAIGAHDGDGAGEVLFWQCPACGGRWHRWDPGHPAYDQACRLMGTSGGPG